MKEDCGCKKAPKDDDWVEEGDVGDNFLKEKTFSVIFSIDENIENGDVNKNAVFNLKLEERVLDNLNINDVEVDYSYLDKDEDTLIDYNDIYSEDDEEEFLKELKSEEQLLKEMESESDEEEDKMRMEEEKEIEEENIKLNKMRMEEEKEIESESDEEVDKMRMGEEKETETEEENMELNKMRMGEEDEPLMNLNEEEIKKDQDYGDLSEEYGVDEVDSNEFQEDKFKNEIDIYLDKLK